MRRKRVHEEIINEKAARHSTQYQRQQVFLTPTKTLIRSELSENMSKESRSLIPLAISLHLWGNEMKLKELKYFVRLKSLATVMMGIRHFYDISF